MANTNKTIKAFNASDRTVHLKDMILLKSEHKAGLVEDDFPDKDTFRSWKNSLALLQNTVTQHGKLVRSGAPDEKIAMTRSAMFEAYRQVLAYFEEPDFKMKPERDDEASLMTMAFDPAATAHSQEYDDAATERREAKKALKEYSEDHKIFSDDDLKVATQDVKTEYARLLSVYQTAESTLEEISKKPGASIKIAKAHSEAKFRASFEVWFCERLGKRAAMTAEEVREAKKARNKRTAQKRKAAAKAAAAATKESK